jgi:hypothetical protein
MILDAADSSKKKEDRVDVYLVEDLMKDMLFVRLSGPGCNFLPSN